MVHALKPSSTVIQLRLFVVTGTPRSARARAKVAKLVSVLPGYRLEVIDVIQQSEQAAREQILIAPTLVIDAGTSAARVVGDLFDDEDALLALLAQQNVA